MANVEHLLFDLSEVWMNGLMDLPDKIEESISIKTPSLEKHLNNLHSDFFGGESYAINDLFTGKLSEEEFFGRFLREHDFPFSIEELKKMTRGNFWEFTHTEGMLEKLKSNDYNLILISDHGREWIDFIEKNFPFLSLFDTKIYSFDSGHTKGDAEAFEYAVKKSGIDPQKTLFTDDLLENIGIAKKVGIRYAHIYRGPERLMRNFRELGIRGYS